MKNKSSAAVTKKNKHRPSYTLFENLRYVICGMKQWQPTVLPATIIYGITQGLSVFVWLYTTRFIISLFENPGHLQDGRKILLPVVAAAALLELIMLTAANLCEKQAEGRMQDVRFKYILMWAVKVWTMPFVLHEHPGMKDEIHKASMSFNDMSRGLQGMHYWLSQMLPALISSVAAAIVIFTFSPVIVAVMTVLAIIRFFAVDRAAAYEKTESVDKVAADSRFAAYLNETTADYAYAKDIRMFQMQQPLYQMLRKTNHFLNQKVKAAQNKYVRSYVFGDILEFGQELLTYILLLTMVVRGSITIADFTLYVGSIHSFAVSIADVLVKFARFNFESRRVSDYREMLAFTGQSSAPRPKMSFADDYRNYGAAPLHEPPVHPPDPQGDYEFFFDQVSFRYPGTSKYALKDLTITVKAGEKLAVVGLNGAGKSTFVKLLCRLYEPTAGVIYLNGKDISTYPLAAYFAVLAPVFQEDESLAFSITHNVSMQTAAASDRALVYTSLCRAQMQEKVDRLPAGIDTSLYKDLDDLGMDLSGGQKQKIMLARALYKNAPVVILDEPTAALDAIAESKSYEDFNCLIENRTTVYISHRLSSTKFCDRIAMFEAGALIEYGTHDELLARGGRYAELFEVQSRYYTEEGSNIA